MPMAAIAEFCRRWELEEFALFGSVLRDDFGPDSDVDVMVRLGPEHSIGLWQLSEMEQELEGIFGRHVDLGTREGFDESADPIIRRSILPTLRVIYAK